MKFLSTVRTLSAAASAAFLFGAVAEAQTNLYTLQGDKANDRLGVCVRSAGDVNNDGKPDVIVGAPENAQPFAAGQGFARVYNGMTGGILYTFDGGTLDDAYGLSVDGAGDVNMDGFADLVIGAPQANSLQGQVFVRSGQTGAILYTFGGSTNDQLGQSVSGAGDVNNDGYADVIAASSHAPGGGAAGNPRGTARIYSGKTGLLIRTHNGVGNGDRLGISVDRVGDVNGDGSSEYILGSYFGGAKIYDGATGGVLRTFTAVVDDRLGYSVAGCGDANGDGIPDVIVGAPQDGNIFGSGNGYAVVYSGANGGTLLTLTGTGAGDRFGISVAGARDITGDGRVELLVGADQAIALMPGYARLFNGQTGALIHHMAGTTNNERYGASVDGLGDINANGNFELIVGVPSSSVGFSQAGRAEIKSAVVAGCAAPNNYCVSTNNSTGQPGIMSSTGTTSIAANNFGLVASQLPANTLGLFFYGANEVQVPFGNGFRCIGGSIFRLPIRNTNAAGVATFSVNYATLPSAGPITAGTTWKFQYWYRNPAAGGANFNLTNGLSALFCN